MDCEEEENDDAFSPAFGSEECVPGPKLEGERRVKKKGTASREGLSKRVPVKPGICAAPSLIARPLQQRVGITGTQPVRSAKQG